MYLYAQLRLDLIVAQAKRDELREHTRLHSFQERCLEDYEQSHNCFDALDLIVEEEQSVNVVTLSLDESNKA